jgi:hypothetical protein
MVTLTDQDDIVMSSQISACIKVFYTAANPATPRAILGMAEPIPNVGILCISQPWARSLMSESFASLSHALGRSHCGPHRFDGSGTDKGIRKRSGSPAQHEEPRRTTGFPRRLDKQAKLAVFGRKHSGAFCPPKFIMNH